MASLFEIDTAVEPLGDGRFRASMSTNWWIVRGPNGGYIAAMITAAVQATEPDRPLRSLTLHYLSPPREGEVDIEVTVNRRGRQFAFLSIRMFQLGKLVVTAMAACSRALPGPRFLARTMPDVGPPDRYETLQRSDVWPDIPLRRQYEMRWAIGPMPGTREPDSTTIGGWIRLGDATGSRPYDERLLVALTDAWVPVVFSRLEMGNPVPTIDLTVHVRERPRPDDDWFLAVFSTRTLVDGFLEEDSEIWTPDGRLLAQGRQLALLIPD